MQDILESVLRGEHNKTAEAGAPNPPTSGPGGGPMDNETTYTPGERYNEQEQHNKQVFGPTGADTPTSPDSAQGQMEIPPNAAPIKPTGEDPENESSVTEPVSNVEPGTAFSESKIDSKSASLETKVAAWRKRAAEVVVHLVDNHEKFSAEIGGTFGAAVKEAASCGSTKKTQAPKKPAGADAPYKTAGTDGEESQSHPFQLVANNDPELMKQAAAIATEELVNARMHGRETARKVAAYLEFFHKEATAQQQQEMRLREQQFKKRAMGGGEMPPEAMAGGAPMPPEALMGGAGGGMPPEAAMGDEGGAPAGAEDPEVVAAAIAELAAEMGVAPEELAQMLLDEIGGGGGGEMPPTAPGGESSGGPDPSMGGGEQEPPAESEPAPETEKTAAAKEHVKKQAREVVSEILRRGKRR